MVSYLRPTTLAAAALAAALAGPSASATTIATTTFDTDSYIPYKTNNATSSEITLGVPNPGYNFNFGVIEFDDLGAVPAGGSKFLVVDLEAFVTYGDAPEGGGPPPVELTPTGSATIKVVGLGSSYGEVYADAGTTASQWYDTYIGNADADATATPTNAGLVSFDVTEVVDGWLNDPTTNHGFGLVVASGQPVELGASSDFLTSDSVAPTLSTVPEPGSMAILALGAVGLLHRRR